VLRKRQLANDVGTVRRLVWVGGELSRLRRPALSGTHAGGGDRDASAPALVVPAGPNGAGRTTAAPCLLRDAPAVTGFVPARRLSEACRAWPPGRLPGPLGAEVGEVGRGRRRAWLVVPAAVAAAGQL
jgi:hypothetical protein